MRGINSVVGELVLRCVGAGVKEEKGGGGIFFYEIIWTCKNGTVH